MYCAAFLFQSVASIGVPGHQEEEDMEDLGAAINHAPADAPVKCTECAKAAAAGSASATGLGVKLARSTAAPAASAVRLSAETREDDAGVTSTRHQTLPSAITPGARCFTQPQQFTSVD